MDWHSLADDETTVFGRGVVFRTPAKWPYEDFVDFMMVENSESPSRFTLIVATGYKAGLPLIHLPEESLDKDSGGIDGSWLRNNWQKWVYEDSDLEQVYFAQNYAIDSDWVP